MPGVSFCIGTILGTFQSDQVTTVNFVNRHQPSIITLRRFFSHQNHRHSFCLNQSYLIDDPSVINAICWHLGKLGALFKGIRATPCVSPLPKWLLDFQHGDEL